MADALNVGENGTLASICGPTIPLCISASQAFDNVVAGRLRLEVVDCKARCMIRHQGEYRGTHFREF